MRVPAEKPPGDPPGNGRPGIVSLARARAIVAEMRHRDAVTGFLNDWWGQQLDALATTLAPFEASPVRTDEAPPEPRPQEASGDQDRPIGLGDTVETVKGAQFWGIVIALDADLANPGCTVLATAEGFKGTKHVYPLKQLRHRVEEHL